MAASSAMEFLAYSRENYAAGATLGIVFTSQYKLMEIPSSGLVLIAGRE
jgi:hypothetical protein